jgi:DNA-binding transcriptional regulator/RsmH inhibitor MraZ
MPVMGTLTGLALLAAALWLVAASAGAAEAPALFAIRAGDLHGLIDARGRTVLPAEFAEVAVGDPLVMARKGARTAYFDTQGALVVAPQDAWRHPFSAGVVPAAVRDAQGRTRWGYATPSGAMAIAPAYDEAGPFVDGLAVVGVADAWGQVKYGAIDSKGTLVLPAVHDKLLAPAGGLVRSESRERTHRVFDARGRELTPPGVDFVGLPSDGLVRVWTGRQQGFMGVTGELRVAPRFEAASDFHQGRARVWVQGQYGYIDAQGDLVVPARYDSAEDFSDGLALVRQAGRSLFIDRQGRTVLQPQADRVWPFANGLAAIKVGPLHGYIDTHGQVVIEPRFNFVRPFHQGLAYVGQGRTRGYINPQGRFVWQSESP